MTWQTWVRGLVGAIVGGAANAITIMIVDPQNFNFQSGGSKLLTFAGVSALISAALFLKQSPIPCDEAKSEEAKK